MVANIRGYTDNYQFRLINFDTPRWHTLEYANWQQLDAMLFSAGVAQVRGEWLHSTLYLQGERVFDGVTNDVYRCLVQHTSPATGTFAEYRTANPTHWALQIAGTPVFRGAWTPTTVYALGDIVHVGAYQYYLCDLAHTSAAAFATDVANWQLIFDTTATVAASEGFADDAEASANAAALSASNADTSEANAATSASNADTSEANALQWQSNASQYASNAQTSASNAATSEINAANSATTATDKAAEAVISADSAAASASAILQANAFPWLFDASTTIADPGVGNIRLNNAALASVTQIAISALTAAPGNPNVGNWIISWDDSSAVTKGQLIIRENASPQNFAIYNISGNITNNSTWGIVPVAYVSHANSFDAADTLNVEFTRSGNDGISGSGSGDMLSANNLSDVQSVPQSRTNLGLGTGDAPVFNGMTLTGALVLPAGAPTLATHATNKAYVDGHVADTGDTMTGDLIITSPTASSSNITGALQVTGGVGVQGRMNVGGQFVANAANVFHSFGGGGAGYSGIRVAAQGGADQPPVLSLFRSGILDASFNVAPGTSPHTVYLSTGTAGYTDAALAAAAKFSWTHTGIFNALVNVPSNSAGTGSIVSNGGIGAAGNVYAGGIFSSTIKGNRFGGAVGTAMPVAPANTDANIKLYDGGATNWAGIGTDVLGNMWFKVGSSGTPLPVVWLSAATQLANFTGNIVLGAEPTANNHAATKLYVDTKASVNKPAFAAYPTVAQTFLNETPTKVNFAGTINNQGGHYNTTNSRWTPPAGTIRITAGIAIDSGLLMGTVLYIYIYKNGAYTRRRVCAVNATYGSAHISAVDNCNGTDYYEIYIMLHTGTNGAFTPNGNAHHWFDGSQI